MNPKTSILVVGSANMDLVFGLERLPISGETLLGDDLELHPGGKGANQAVAIGQLGGHVGFVGAVGRDSAGDVLVRSLSDANVSISHLVRSDRPTGSAGIFVDRTGNNMIVVAPGANSEVSSEQVERAIGEANPAIVLAQLEIPLEAVIAASQAYRFVLNPAPAKELPSEVLQRCWAITPNETELQSLTGIDPVDDASCEQAGRKLLDHGVANVIVTLGEKGAAWVSAGGIAYFPPLAVAPIDTTAAGDAFNGGLAIFLAEGRDFPNSIALANCVAALSTRRRGAQPSMPNMAELREVAGHLL